MFIIRTAFWLTVVILLIPGDPNSGSQSPGVGALDAIFAARGAVADLSGMCERQPEVCVNGGAALQAFGAKARYGASLLYETIDSKLPAQGAAAPGGTLTPGDADPAWRLPVTIGGKA